MATTVTFTQTESGSAAITIRAPGYPYKPGTDYPGIIVGRTASGGFRVANHGPSSNPVILPTLRWVQLSDSDFSDLKDWIEQDIQYQLYKFTYTDHDSTAHTNMRYLRGLDTFRLQPNNLWAGELVIAKDWDA